MFSDIEGDSDMKKAISILLFLMMTVLLCSGAMAAVTEDGTYITGTDGVITYRKTILPDSADSYVTIIGYTGTSPIVTIPASVADAPVTRIEYRVFKGNTYLKEVIIEGASLQSIGWEAFRGCTNLEKINLPSSLTAIEHTAFYECSSLTEISIPDAVHELEYGIFSFCTSLKSAKLPANLTDIPNGLFQGCTALESVNIPASISKIEPEAFKDCKLITSIVVPDNVTSIGSEAFNGCTSLRSITLPNGLESLEQSPGLNGVFSNCTSLESIIIPGGIRTIYESTFYNCTSLKTVVVKEYPNVEYPKQYMTIKYDAFEGCTSLEKVYLPKTLYELERNAFPSNRSTKYYVYSDSPWLDSSGITYSQRVFMDKSAFSEYGMILLPDTLELTAGRSATIKAEIAPNILIGSPALTWTSSNPQVASLSSNGYAKQIVVRAHAEGTAVITANAEGVTASMLVTVAKVDGLLALPANLKTIADEAFRGVDAKHIIVPASVIEIGANAFDDCIDKLRVEITSPVIDIDENAFGDTNVYILCLEGSPAMEFAIEHGYPYKLH